MKAILLQVCLGLLLAGSLKAQMIKRKTVTAGPVLTAPLVYKPAVLTFVNSRVMSAYGTVISETNSVLTASFFNAWGVCTFDTSGRLLSSTGNTSTLGEITMIRIFEQSYIMNNPAVETSGQQNLPRVAIQMNNGNFYYAARNGWWDKENNRIAVRVSPGNEDCDLIYYQGKWSVGYSKFGAMPRGTQIKSVYAYPDVQRIFFTKP